MRLRSLSLLGTLLGLALFVGAACSPNLDVREERPGAAAGTATEVQPDTPTGASVPGSEDKPDATAQFAPLLDVSDLVRLVEPSVVRIDSRSLNTLQGGIGTGFVVDSDGLILTNNHVIELSNGDVAPSITVTLYDGSEYQAEVVGRYVHTDTALLRIAAAELVPLELGSLADTDVGDPVVAFGFALDLERGENGGFTVTTGIVSAKNRQIEEEQATILGSIQTDAAINPGNSGGPLVNLRGEVVGMNTAIATNPNLGGVASGIGFAVGVDTLRAVYEELRELGRVDRGLLGIQNFEAVRAAQARELGVPEELGGISIGSVDPAGPVAVAGLQSGDVIVRIGDTDISTEADLVVALIRYDAGDLVEVTFYRGAEVSQTAVTLGAFPE
jgi:S1-C subfamily serine protease